MDRRRLLLCVAAAVCIVSCGYIGPVQPPSLHIPVAVTDLSAFELADAISIQFTLPSLTTDTVTIGKLKAVDLRVGLDVSPFDLNQWALRAKQIPVSEQDAVAGQDPDTEMIKTSFPAAEWVGHTVVIAVRTVVRDARFSQWSNIVRIRIVQPLETPVVTAASDAKVVKLTFAPQQEGAKYRVVRQGPNEPQPIEVGTADAPEFFDGSAEYGVAYRYTATAFDDSRNANAQSKPSETVSITSKDDFPPSVPANVTLLAGPDSVEVSWERSPEPDTKGFYIYRSTDGSPFERKGDLVSIPAFSDKDVQRGKKYRYEISAIDERGNESAHSQAVEITF
jgi:hypothetical protein